jgi:8-oxo-dGTP diphosphatase
MTEQQPLQVAVGVIKNSQGQVLVALRHQHAHQGGLWEFPGGKVAPGESVIMALRRELKEELDIHVVAASPLITIRHAYPDRFVQLNVLRVDHYLGQPRGCEGQAIRWVDVDELAQLAFPTANAPIISAVCLPDYYAILDAATLKANAIPQKVASFAIVDELLINLQQLLAQDIKLIQARLKDLAATYIQQFLEHALPLCADASACLILNSTLSGIHPPVDSLHLTSQALMALQQRPAQLRWLAASCHNLEQLQHAEAIGVDFAVLAPVLTTPTHPHAETLGWDQFGQWVDAVNIPVYALGGMQKSDLEQAKQVGAQGIAGIRLFLN